MARFTSIDGGLVQIDGAGVAVEQEGASMIGVFRGPTGSMEFTVAPVSFGHGDGGSAEEGVRLTEEYSLVGRQRLRVGSARAQDAVSKSVARSVLGVWLGDRFSVHGWITGDDSPVAPSQLTGRLISVFNQFSFTETPTGVVIRPRTKHFALARDGSGAPTVARYIDGIGLLDAVQRTPEQAWRIPRERGAAVAGGELWVSARDPGHDGDDALLVFLLVTDTALVHINTDVGAVPEDVLLDRCSRLTVEWQPDRAP